MSRAFPTPPRRLVTAVVAIVSVGLPACGGGSAGASAPAWTPFANPERVEIRGYDDHAMEPFLARDGAYLFFNNSNAPSAQTDIHYAVRVDDLTFDYRGLVMGANSGALDGVPTMDRDGTFYFVSVRDYAATLSTVHTGRFADGALTDVGLVPGISRREPGIVNFDVEVSPDGGTLWFVDGVFRSGEPVPRASDIVVAERSGPGFVRRADSAALLRNVNTADREYAVAISADGRELFFTRLHADLTTRTLVARRADPTGPFGVPQPIAAITGFAEAPTLSPDERSLYYHRRDGTRFVLYRVTRDRIR